MNTALHGLPICQCCSRVFARERCLKDRLKYKKYCPTCWNVITAEKELAKRKVDQQIISSKK